MFTKTQLIVTQASQSGTLVGDSIMFCLALPYRTIPRIHKTNMYRKLHLLFAVLRVYVLTTESFFLFFCRFHLDLLESHSLDGYCLLLVLDDTKNGMRELHISNNHRHVRLLRYQSVRRRSMQGRRE